MTFGRTLPSSRTPGGPEHNTITGTTVRTRGFDLKKRTFGVTLTTGGPLISKISLFKTVGGRMHLSCTSLASNLSGGMAGRRTPSSSPSCQIGSRRLSAVLFLDHARRDSAACAILRGQDWGGAQLGQSSPKSAIVSTMLTIIISLHSAYSLSAKTIAHLTRSPVCPVPSLAPPPI